MSKFNEVVSYPLLNNLPLVKKFHYAQLATTTDYWVAFYKSRIKEYKENYGENFNLIIYGNPEIPNDFYSIPYSEIKGYLDETSLISDRWTMHIRDGILDIRIDDKVEKINIEKFYANPNNILQLVNIEEYSRQVEIKQKILKIEKIDLKEFVESVNLNDLSKKTPIIIKNPEKIPVNEIIKNCTKGKWVLPRFQRYFSWKEEDIRSFLEAIFNNYYVGSFLLWKVEKSPELDIQLIKGISLELNEEPDSIILDGQQRITSLIYSIFSPNIDLFLQDKYWDDSKIYAEHPLYFYINFAEYLKNSKSTDIIFIHTKKIDRETCFNHLIFPFYELENYYTWISEFAKYLRAKSNNLDKIDEIRDIMHSKLSHLWHHFEIPYILLPNSIGLDQVTDIFLGVNTKGRVLGIFDLLIAKMYKNKIDFKKLWENTLTKYPKIKIYAEFTKQEDKMPLYILTAISLFYDKNHSAKRTDILDIYKNLFENSNRDFEQAWFEFSDYTNGAISRLENLRDGFGVKSEKDVPYAATIPIIAALLKLIDDYQGNVQCYEKLKKWYWASIFTTAYSQAADSQLTSDYKEMIDWFSDDKKIPRSVQELIREIDVMDFQNINSVNDARYRGILSLVALEGANDFHTGQKLENARSNDKDHIFPKQSYSKFENINCVLNMTWCSTSTNRHIKKAKKPSIYIKEFINENYQGNEKSFIDILDKHLISRQAYWYLLNDDFQSFIKERENTIKVKIKEIFEIPTEGEKSLISPDTPYTNKRIIINKLKVCEGYIKWVDKYFSKPGFDILLEAVNNDKIKDIFILRSSANLTSKFRDEFKAFKEELKNKGINVELRVIIEPKISRNIHDRWILAKNVVYNIPSTDVVARGQYSEINETMNRPPFEDWWMDSKDILTQWNEIERNLQK